MGNRELTQVQIATHINVSEDSGSHDIQQDVILVIRTANEGSPNLLTFGHPQSSGLKRSGSLVPALYREARGGSFASLCHAQFDDRSAGFVAGQKH